MPIVHAEPSALAGLLLSATGFISAICYVIIRHRIDRRAQAGQQPISASVVRVPESGWLAEIRKALLHWAIGAVLALLSVSFAVLTNDGLTSRAATIAFAIATVLVLAVDHARRWRTRLLRRQAFDMVGVLGVALFLIVTTAVAATDSTPCNLLSVAVEPPIHAATTVKTPHLVSHPPLGRLPRGVPTKPPDLHLPPEGAVGRPVWPCFSLPR